MIKKALCIGNANYPNDGALNNPVNDARDLAEKLKTLGFECRLCADETDKGMDDALREFASDLVEAEVGLFFFAGHGMQIDGENYLTGINTNFDTEVDAKYSSLRLNKVIDVLDRGQNNTSIIILDACRNNPYERRWRNRTASGLAPVNAPKGTIIAYATSPGELASDGSDGNGAFTGALLKHISEQDYRIEDLFKRVRNTLSAMTSGKQTSWEHTSLMGDFYFNPAVLTNEFISEYSPDAKADKMFRASGLLREVIDGLKVCVWANQNEAMAKLDGIELRLCSKDELFVLGRNIYQSACGTAHRAESYLERLRSQFQYFDKEVAFHILNGILYEMYFDSSDRFREKIKVDKIAEVFALEGNERYGASFQFIQQSLKPYYTQLFYIPGSARTVPVDVVLKLKEASKLEVMRIVYDSQDIFYSQDGVTLYEGVQSYFEKETSVSDFETLLAREMAVPRYYLSVTYSDNRVKAYPLLFPLFHTYKIQRLSKKSPQKMDTEFF
jgi:Caspase domain